MADRRRAKAPLPPIPTLGQLARSTPWMYIRCAAQGCYHSVSVRLAPLIERYGADASSDVIRNNARCKKCGHKGATLGHPSYNGANELTPFPGDPE